MKKKIALIGGAVLLGLVILSLALSSQNGENDKTDAAHRAELHEFIDNRTLFLRSDRSPVDPMHRLKIESLEWFAVDKKYRVEARLERTPPETDRPGPETEGPKVAGIVHFLMNGALQKPTAYWDAPDAFDRLFIPVFQSKTAGYARLRLTDVRGAAVWTGERTVAPGANWLEICAMRRPNNRKTAVSIAGGSATNSFLTIARAHRQISPAFSCRGENIRPNPAPWRQKHYARGSLVFQPALNCS